MDAGEGDRRTQMPGDGPSSPPPHRETDHPGGRVPGALRCRWRGPIWPCGRPVAGGKVEAVDFSALGLRRGQENAPPGPGSRGASRTCSPQTSATANSIWCWCSSCTCRARDGRGPCSVRRRSSPGRAHAGPRPRPRQPHAWRRRAPGLWRPLRHRAAGQCGPQPARVTDRPGRLVDRLERRRRHASVSAASLTGSARLARHPRAGTAGSRRDGRKPGDWR